MNYAFKYHCRGGPQDQNPVKRETTNQLIKPAISHKQALRQQFPPSSLAYGFLMALGTN